MLEPKVLRLRRMSAPGVPLVDALMLKSPWHGTKVPMVDDQ